ncbi:G-box-binding factor [Salix suchowensis]|nr:G-box-binding factor [Salix suchowensis]
MAVPLEDLQSWLTTKGKLSMDKENFNKNCFNTELKPSLSFFSEFPYEFDSLSSPSALSSPVESSMGSSTETESSDEDDFLGGLTRRLTQQLANKWVKAGSPESTLGELGSWSVSSNGSPDGVLSPPMTPFGAKNDSWDLIYAAAGQVARLKMNNNEGLNALLGPTRTQNPGLTSVKIQPAGFYPSHCSSSFGHKTPEVNQYQQFVRKEQQALKQQCSSIWERQQIQSRSTCVGDENGRFVRSPGLPQSAWPPLQVHAQNQRCNSTGTRAVLLGGSGVKRESAGTGVFLPRRYGNPPEPKKKNGGCSTVLLPARVVQALNLNFDDMDIKGLTQPRLNSNAAFPSDYDALMIRRNALVAQQKRSLRQESVLNHEIRLPQEWTY